MSLKAFVEEVRGLLGEASAKKHRPWQHKSKRGPVPPGGREDAKTDRYAPCTKVAPYVQKCTGPAASGDGIFRVDRGYKASYNKGKYIKWRHGGGADDERKRRDRENSRRRLKRKIRSILKKHKSK